MCAQSDNPIQQRLLLPGTRVGYSRVRVPNSLMPPKGITHSLWVSLQATPDGIPMLSCVRVCDFFPPLNREELTACSGHDARRELSVARCVVEPAAAARAELSLAKGSKRFFFFFKSGPLFLYPSLGPPRKGEIVASSGRKGNCNYVMHEWTWLFLRNL